MYGMFGGFCISSCPRMDVSRMATLVMEPPAELQLTLPSYYYSGVFVILVSGTVQEMLYATC